MKLAIQGHPERGKEVIEILEMLGGINELNLKGIETNSYYYRGDSINKIYRGLSLYPYDYKIYTLEEFLEKFPYKVGDRVRVADYESEVRIDSMEWDGNEVQYEVFTDMTEWYSAEELNLFNEPYKEETMEEDKGTLVAIDLTMEFRKANEIEVILGDYEFVLKDGKTYFVKKNKYPKTYEECCKILDCKANDFFTDFSYNGCDVEISDYEDKIDGLLQNFRNLIYCRDAYWKIAGDWKPDFLNPTKETRYFLFCTGTTIENGQGLFPTNKILIFPTEEMRDAFYENFKDLIEQCKELL